MSPDEQTLHLERGREKLDAARAYYAMYHGAHALLRSVDEAPRTHRGTLHVLTQRFGAPSGLGEENVARFQKAQSLRERGDYDIVLDVGGEVSEELISDADAFLRRVEELLDRS